VIQNNNGISYIEKGTILMLSHFHEFVLVKGTYMKTT